MRTTLIRTSAVAGLAAACLVAMPVGAQQPVTPQQPGAPQGMAPPMTFSADQLDAFAAAAHEVTALQREYGARMDEAGSPEQAADLRRQAGEEMAQAVEEQGLTPEEYNAILQAAQADPTLYAMIVERLQAAQ